LTESHAEPIRFRDSSGKKQGAWILRDLITKEVSKFTLIVVAPDGAIKEVPFDVRVQGWNEYSENQRKKTRKPLGFQVGLGYTQGVYRQSPSVIYQQGTLTMKLGYGMGIPGVPLDIAANIFGTVAPLFDNDASATAWTLGGNIRLGVRVTPRAWKWRVNIAAGLYMINYIENTSAFGFTLLTGPELYPSLSYRWKKDRAWTYFKYAPVWNGAGFNSLASREFAIGLGYARGVGRGMEVLATLDFADFRFVNGGLEGQLDTLTLSTGFTF
jgi:hypothetical protein